MPALTFEHLIPTADAPPPDMAGSLPPAASAAPSDTAAPVASPGPLTFDHLIPKDPQSQDSGWMDQAKDIAKSAGSGYLKGVAGLVGGIPDVANLIARKADDYQSYMTGRPVEDIRAENNARAIFPTTTLDKYGTASQIKRLENLGQAVSGQDRTLYQPQTTAGKYAGSVAEFLPGTALGGGGSVARNAVAFGVVPGVAAEAGGEAAAAIDPSYEGYGRLAGALVGGGAGAFATRPTTAGAIVERSANMTPLQVDAMEALIRDGQARGVDISRAEAAQQVTNGATRLGDLQRVVEGNGGLKEFYANRPQQVEAAGRAQFEQFTPRAPDPSTIGPQVQDAARAGMEATPEAQTLSQRVYEAGPRVTPEQAGQVIQPELRGVYDRREGARAAVADQEYRAARNSDSRVPVDEKMVDVSRTTERPMTQAEAAAAGPGATTAGGATGPAPLTLTQYIARNGGLSLEGGEAAAAGFDKINVPFGGNLARPNGKSIDSHWRERLTEDGYLPHDPDGGMSRDIRDELFTALHNERQGQPTYSAYDFDKVSARGAKASSAENAEFLDKARSDIIRDHYRAGVKPSDLDPATLDKAAHSVASGAETDSLAAYNRAARETPMVTEQVTEKVPQTVYGQASPNPVVQHIDRQLETAKGGIAKDLEATKRDLYAKDGTVDGSVEGLQNAREAINERIEAAKANSRNHAVGVLTEVRNRLDAALEQVPEQAVANRNFQANSVSLAPFDNTPPIGKVIAKDDFNQRFTLPPERVPGTLEQGGPSTARQFNEVAPPAAREAFEQHLTTQVLDAASKGGADLSADAIRTALRQNQDLLAQYPGVRDRLTNVAIARDGLERIQGTPLAKLAKAQPEVGKAVEVMFPSNPTPGSAGEVGAAVRAVADRNPWAARQLVRVHAESVFNEATQATQGGLNQFGGATYAAVLRGNMQQAENLGAAVRALPGGERVLEGFDRFLEIMQATGQRQRIGSQTAFNTELNAAMKSGGTVREIAAAIASGGFKVPGRVMGRIDAWNAGRNTEGLAQLLTDPAAADAFRHLVTAPPTSGKALALASRLTAIGFQGSREPATATR